jgi:hypothetical protein
LYVAHRRAAWPDSVHGDLGAARGRRCYHRAEAISETVFTDAERGRERRAGARPDARR